MVGYVTDERGTIDQHAPHNMATELSECGVISKVNAYLGNGRSGQAKSFSLRSGEAVG